MAIMVTPKLANLPDVTTTAPSDGQVLTYDDGTGQWVNEAVPAGVTDHGALTGLADDDHSQYILVTAARAFTGSPSAPGAGVNSERFGSGATAAGADATAIGKGASAAGSRNVAIGYLANASGAFDSIVIGKSSTASGTSSIIIANNGTVGTNNSVVIGSGATVGGADSISIGANADGATGGYRNILLGAYTDCGTYGDTVAIGRLATNTANNQMMIGNHAYSLAIVQKSRASNTNAIASAITIDHASTGTPAAGFGAGILFQLESSTTDSQDAARISAVWSDATHATRTGDIVFSTVSGAAALSEKLRLTGAGILKFSGTMGNSTKVPGTDAPADWVQIDIGGTTYYLPAYAA